LFFQVRRGFWQSSNHNSRIRLLEDGLFHVCLSVMNQGPWLLVWTHNQYQGSQSVCGIVTGVVQAGRCHLKRR
jgi:uncharacterized membrane protein